MAAIVTKKPRGNGRKALKPKDNIMPQEVPSSPAAKGKDETKVYDFESALKEMQEKMKNMKIEKEKAEEMLKAKEEELENKGREQEKLQLELKKLQKLKDFKPTVNFGTVSSMEDEAGKKKKSSQVHKRPSSPYILWCKDQRAEIKKENPNAEFEAISNILGAKWKTISAEEKKPYEEKYKIEKEAYLKVVKKEKRELEAMKLLEEEQKQKTAMELLEQYLQFKQEADKENFKKSKKGKDPLKPKQPVSAFLLYSNERRAALMAEGKNVVEAARSAGEEWKSMDSKQRAPFEEMAKEKKELYLQEMEAYKQMKEGEAMNMLKEEQESKKIQKQEAMKLLKKKEKTENLIKKNKEQQKKKHEETDANKPKKPASSFFLFSKETREALMKERPGTSNSIINSLISIKWKELNEDDRKIWNSKAALAMEAYKKQLAEYNKSRPEVEAKDIAEQVSS